MECPSSMSLQELREACDYFIIPFNETTVKTTDLCENYVYVCMYSMYVCHMYVCAFGLVHCVRLSEMIFGEVYCIVPTLCGQ